MKMTVSANRAISLSEERGRVIMGLGDGAKVYITFPEGTTIENRRAMAFNLEISEPTEEPTAASEEQITFEEQPEITGNDESPTVKGLLKLFRKRA